MRKFLSAVVFAATALSIGAPATAEDTLYLNCKSTECWNSISDKTRSDCSHLDFTVIVDLGKSTIRYPGDTRPPNPAVISADSISTSWKDTWSYGYREASLSIDRISGAYTSSSDQHTKSYLGSRHSGICTKADGPKF